MKKIIFLILALSTVDIYSKTPEKKDSYLSFFEEKALTKKKKYRFNKYENIISGVAAFTIGNVGYLLTDSSVLKLSYTGIQTIGVVNIGKGIYKFNSPSFEFGFHEYLKSKGNSKFSAEEVAENVIRLSAQEERAKRLSLLYTSSFLSVQYFLNAFIYDSPDKIKNIYTFLGGVNVIVALYSTFYKGDYEKRYYGEKLDISPFFIPKKDAFKGGLALNMRF